MPQTAARFEATLALGVYRGDLRDAIIRMKQSANEALTMAVGQLAAKNFGEQLSAESIDIVIPVPIHWTRRFSRGVNVSELLAEPIAARCGLEAATPGSTMLSQDKETRNFAPLRAARECSQRLRGFFKVRCQRSKRLADRRRHDHGSNGERGSQGMPQSRSEPSQSACYRARDWRCVERNRETSGRLNCQEFNQRYCLVIASNA